LPLAKGAGGLRIRTWFGIPIAAYTFPLIGFFLAPIYPAINSIVLSSLPKSKHGAMAGLIGLFSALGGTLGSIITGNIFQRYGGQTAFYFSLIPIAILIAALYIFKKTGNRLSSALDDKVLAVEYGVGGN
jgi:MFS transporter, FHS family, glucose/mannose:H+ symporter